MKRLLLCFSLIISILALSSCISLEDNLKAEVDAFNKICPVDYNNGITAIKAINANEQVVFVMEVDEDSLSIDDLEESKDELKDNTKQGLVESLEEFGVFAKLLIKLEKSCVYRFEGNESGKALDIVFSPKELEDIVQKKVKG